MIVNNMNLSIFSNSLRRRFFAWLYNVHEKKKWHDSSILDHRSKKGNFNMMFLQNRSLFDMQFFRNLLCGDINFLVSSWKIRWFCLYIFFKMFKEVVSLTSICNKFLWLIISGTKDFFLNLAVYKSLVLRV